MRKPVIPALVLLATAGLVALTGCSAPAEPATDEQTSSTASEAPMTEATASEEAAAGEQTVEESCAIAQEAMTSVQSEMTDALSSASSGDLTTVIAALETFEVRLGEAVDQVTNPEVDAALTEFQSSFATFNELIAGAADGGIESIDQAALQTAQTDLQASATGIQELCV